MDIDDADHRVQYLKDTDWECIPDQHNNDIGTTVHVAHIDKASLSLEFNGTGVDVIGFVNNTNSQALLTCAMEDGQLVVPQVTTNDGAQPVTFCSITSLQNKQHTLTVNIGSNGVDNVSIDKFYISTQSPPPPTTSTSAPQTSTSLVQPTTSLSSPALPSQTDSGSESGPHLLQSHPFKDRAVLCQ
ncbi:hypothetical protein C8Q74DRAFT_292560 [Fomes fomentarius]|nr:hypothetical protein C8Q74DRAFT_292560 [Fomes fomentarius]